MNDKLCDLCAAKGLQKKLVYYHVNFEEAMLLCENNMVRIKSILINVIAMRFITGFLGGVISAIVCFGFFFFSVFIHLVHLKLLACLLARGQHPIPRRKR